MIELLNKIQGFVSNILPTVYEDSLSYYNFLNKVIRSMNLLIENNNTIVDKINDLEARVKALEDANG